MDWKLDTIMNILEEIKNHAVHDDEEGDYTNSYLILCVIILPEIRQYIN